MVKKQYHSIDLMKFIACIFVVAIHTNPFNEISPIINTIICQGIARLAVPLFFISSAFFLFQGDFDKSKVKKYCLRMGELYLFWFLLSLPITIYNRIIISPYPAGITVFRFVRSFFLTSTFSGSWFLTSCIFCAIIYCLLEKLDERKRRIITIVICIASYFLCVFTSAYGGLIDLFGLTPIYTIWETLFSKPYTSILVGLPYFALGRHIVKDDVKCSRQHCWGVFLSIILLMGEILITMKLEVTNTTDCYLMLLPCAYFIFVVVKDWTVQLKVSSALRSVSTIVFFSHFIWIFVLELVEFFVEISILCIAKFLITVFLSLATAIIVLKLSKTKGLTWVRNFY